MTTRTELKSAVHVNTLSAVRGLPSNTYVRKVTKLMRAEELKKNDMKMPRT